MEGIQIEFKYRANYEGQPVVNVVVTSNAVTLHEIISNFERFLKGCGFEFDGHLDIVDEEE